jgi:hypothetical protein
MIEATEPEALYGWFSKKAAEFGCGTSYWLRPDGTEVECTDVCREPENERYLWDDKVCVGPVVKWSRSGRRSDFVYSPMPLAQYPTLHVNTERGTK